MSGAGRRYRISQIASRDLVTIARDACLRDAAHLMTERHVSSLVVVDAKHEPVGLLSMSDVNRFLGKPVLRGQPASTLDRPVSEAMTPTLLSVREDCPVVVAARIMVSSRIHRVLVIDGNRYTGLVSLTDIARLVAEVGLFDDPPDGHDDVDAMLDISSPRELFVASLDRCLEHAELEARLATRFLATSAEVRARFAGVEASRRSAVIMAAFRFAADVAVGKPAALARFAEETSLHDRDHRDVRPEMYALWLETVIATVRELDPRCDLVIEHAWRIMMGNVISHMVRRARTSSVT